MSPLQSKELLNRLKLKEGKLKTRLKGHLGEEKKLEREINKIEKEKDKIRNKNKPVNYG